MVQGLYTEVEIADLKRLRKGIAGLKYYDTQGNVFEGQFGGSLKFIENQFNVATQNAVSEAVYQITNNNVNNATTGASQEETNNGIIGDKFVSPNTLNNYSGWNKTKVGLGNVDNTSDIDKPISTAQQAAIDIVNDNSIVYAIALGG